MKMSFAIFALTLASASFTAHAQSFSIGIAGNGYNAQVHSGGYYGQPAYPHQAPGYYHPRPGYGYVPPPPTYYRPPPYYGNQYPRYPNYVNPNPNFRPYRPTCTTYYTQFGPKTECF